MSDHSSALHGDGQDLLSAALSDAFSPTELPRQYATPPVTPATANPSIPLPLSPTDPTSPSTPTSPTSSFKPSPENTPPPPPANDPPPSTASAEEHEAWKAAYEKQVEEWKQESREKREKAREERERWEKKRERERQEMEKLREEMVRSQGSESLSWSKIEIGGSGVASPMPGEAELGEGEKAREELAKRAEEAMRLVQDDSGETSVVDGRALVPGEAEGKHSIEFLERALPRVGPVHTTVAIQTTDLTPPTAPVQEGHTEEPSHSSSSPHWEDVPSDMDSSFPSMSFPDASRSHSETPSHLNNNSQPTHHQHHTAESSHAHAHHEHHAIDDDHKHHARTAATADAHTTATLAIFDGTLSTKTRVWAFASALAINMFLPFVNGVMLGFGELVAKEIIAPWFGWRPAVTRVGLSGAAGGGVAADRRKERERNATRERTGREL